MYTVCGEMQILQKVVAIGLAVLSSQKGSLDSTQLIPDARTIKVQGREAECGPEHDLPVDFANQSLVQQVEQQMRYE
jgi:hypothetical protein